MSARFIVIGLLLTVSVAVVIGISSWLRERSVPEPTVPVRGSGQDVTIPDPSAGPENGSPLAADKSLASSFVPPLPRASERVTKKPFGIFITKADSPVRPERFSGFHTGTDFEIFPEETDADVPVSVICSGKLLMKRSASGYGGVAVQSCVNDGSAVTVVYGHLRLSSIAASVGETLNAGDFLGNLGAGYSVETDGERMRLHLGIHRGTSANILGYVPSKPLLSGWIDPCTLVCHP